VDVNWMLPIEAFEWIEANIDPGSRILEFGSGDGSARLAENYEVWSVEHDEEWLGVALVNYVHAPIVENEISTSVGEVGWYDPAMLEEGIPDSVSLIIIDGPTGAIGRTGVLAHFQVLPDTEYFLIDDVDREVESALLDILLKTIDGEVNIISSAHLRSDESPRRFAVVRQRR
jgi:hypothetical protein